jgi:hypothetical protein
MSLQKPSIYLAILEIIYYKSADVINSTMCYTFKFMKHYIRSTES